MRTHVRTLRDRIADNRRKRRQARVVQILIGVIILLWAIALLDLVLS